MVDKTSKWPAAKGEQAERLLEVIRDCGYPNTAQFAKALRSADGKPYGDQTVRQYFARGRVPSHVAIDVENLTGAAAEWILRRKGEKFPNGPRVFGGSASSRSSEEGRAGADLDVLAIGAVLESLVKAVTENVQGAAEVFEAEAKVLAKAGNLDITPGLGVLGRSLSMAAAARKALAAAALREQRAVPRVRKTS